eukprot:IDg17516t1
MAAPSVVEDGDVGCDLHRALERAEFVNAAVQRIRLHDEDLDDMVCGLPRRLAEMVDKHAKGDARLDRLVAHDTQRSEQAKRMHEELDEEFREFRAWNVLEPRSWMWRTMHKLGFYLSVILSFLRRRRASASRRRPAWTTGHGEVDPDFVSSDFFPEGGLARFNPLRVSSGSLELRAEDTAGPTLRNEGTAPLQAKKRDDSDEQVSDVTELPAPGLNGSSRKSDRVSRRESQRSEGLRSEGLRSEGLRIEGLGSETQMSAAQRREPQRNGGRRRESRRRSRPKSAKVVGGVGWGTTADNGGSPKHRRAQSADAAAEEEAAGVNEDGEKKPSWAQHVRQDLSAIGRDSSTDFWASFGAASAKRS